MDHQLNFEQEEKMIDLKQMFYYLMRKWKTIVLFVLVGVLVGAGFGANQTPSQHQYDPQKADQFAVYQKSQESYQQLLNGTARSVLQQMNPSSVYSSERVFKLKAEENLDEICSRYDAVLADDAVLKELAEASSLNCEEEAIAELITVSVQKEDAFQSSLKVTVLTPTKESRTALVAAMDAKLAELAEQLKQEELSCELELISEDSQYGYEGSVFLAQQAVSKALNYGKELVKQAETGLTAEEKAYYAGNPDPNAEPAPSKASLKGIVKWALIMGFVFAVMAVGVYALYFIFSDTLKSADMLRDQYRLYVVGLLASGRKESRMDRLFSGDTLPVNSEEYLQNALSVLAGESTVLSGDQSNAAVSGLMQRMGDQLPELKQMDRLAAAADALPIMQEADGVILVVQLWKTTDAEIQREMEIAHRLQKPIKGVVVIKA